jgi:hypothetical protein
LTSDDPKGRRDVVENGLPTAALAVIELPTARWSDIEWGRGILAKLILPRELD